MVDGLQRLRIQVPVEAIVVDQVAQPVEGRLVLEPLVEALQGDWKIDHVALVADLLIELPEALLVLGWKKAAHAPVEVLLHEIVVQQRVVDVEEEDKIRHSSAHPPAWPLD